MAIYEQDKVFYSEESNGDKTIYLPITRANNVEGLGRSANTAYSVGEVVYIDNNKKVSLKCTTAGTTSDSELDISSANIGDSVADGGVVWQVCNRTSDVTSVNGSVGDVVINVPVASVNGEVGDVEIFDDMADYIVESYRNGTDWYEVYKSGKVRQGGLCSLPAYWTTNTFLKPFADTNYSIRLQALNDIGTTYYLYPSCVAKRSGTQFDSGVRDGDMSFFAIWVAEGQGA